ncbi:MAG: glycosyltransferase family 4 protein [Deferrisoma sp.]
MKTSMHDRPSDANPTPLTVVHITSSTNRSGGTRQAFLLARAQADAGLRVIVCAPEEAAILDWAENSGIPAKRLPRLGSLWSQWRASRGVRRIVREAAADLVHAHHTKGHNVALLATFGGGFPPVIANRGVLFPARFPLKFRTPRTSAVITNSLRVKRVLESAGVAGGKIHVVPNARDTSGTGATERADPALLRRQLGLPPGVRVVGAVGRARPEKGFQHLIEAAPAVLSAVPDTFFLLVGAGTERFVPTLRRFGVADRFVLPGHRDDAVDLMRLFDVFVIPSVDMESAPNTLLEAMSVGVPAVGTNIGGIPEIIEEGRTGYVVTPGDPEALARAVVRLLQDPERAREMGEAGRRKIEEEFSVEAKVRATFEVYEKVLRQCGRRPSS